MDFKTWVNENFMEAGQMLMCENAQHFWPLAAVPVIRDYECVELYETYQDEIWKYMAEYTAHAERDPNFSRPTMFVDFGSEQSMHSISSHAEFARRIVSKAIIWVCFLRYRGGWRREA